MNGDWVAAYVNHCSDYHLAGAFPQIKVLDGYTVGWAEGTARPEMDFKEVPQPEVYAQDPPRSGVGFLPYSTFNCWMRTETPIQIAAGVSTKLQVALMIVAHGEEGDPGKIGDCGMRVGISPPGAEDLGDSSIVWMLDPEWRTVRKPGEPGANAEEYVWYVDETPEFVPSVGLAHIWIHCVANVAANISAGHFDLIQVLQKSDQPVPPIGDYKAVIYDPNGTIIAEVSFPCGGAVNPQICSLAQQIQVLSCAEQENSRGIGLLSRIKEFFGV